MTVDELLDNWLKTATRDVEEGTATNYDNAIRPIRRRLGHMRVQQLTEEDVEAFIDWMVTEGRQRGGKPGTGRSVRSARLSLGRLRSALTLAVRRGIVVRNVAEHVKVSREAQRKAAAVTKTRGAPWDQDEVRQFLAGIVNHRLCGPMMLAFIAERPAEVCGTRWAEDVDLDAGTIAVGDNTRTIVYDRTLEKGQRNKVVEKTAKTDAGRRALPLPIPVLRALSVARTVQAQEKEYAGRGYEDSGYVLVDELGRPFKTDKLRREAYKLMDATGVRRVRVVRRAARCPHVDGEQRRARHRRLGVGRAHRPQFHEAGVCALRPAQSPGRVGEAGGVAGESGAAGAGSAGAAGGCGTGGVVAGWAAAADALPPRARVHAGEHLHRSERVPAVPDVPSRQPAVGAAGFAGRPAEAA